jgi:hypothetical protein
MTARNKRPTASDALDNLGKAEPEVPQDRAPHRKTRRHDPEGPRAGRVAGRADDRLGPDDVSACIGTRFATPAAGGPSGWFQAGAERAPREPGSQQGGQLAPVLKIEVDAASLAPCCGAPLVGARESDSRVDATGRVAAGPSLRSVVERREVFDRRESPCAAPGERKLATMELGSIPRQLATGVARRPHEPRPAVAYDALAGGDEARSAGGRGVWFVSGRAPARGDQQGDPASSTTHHVGLLTVRAG